MSNDKIKLKIITHENIVFEKEINEFSTQGLEGRFGILPNHIPITSALDIGVTKIITDGETEYITTMGGVLQFRANVAVILTDTAEMGCDIDLARAKIAKEQAEARLKAHENSPETTRAQIALAKALARIKAASQGKDGL